MAHYEESEHPRGDDGKWTDAGGEHAFIRAYHGTPHDLRRFSLDKIGTGEGNAAYGWGLYFAENKAVADQYAKQVKDTAMMDSANARMSELVKIMDADRKDRYGDRSFKTSAGEAAAKEYDDLMAKKQSDTGSVYTVKLKIADDEILDWDAKMSEQSATVRNRVARAFVSVTGRKPEMPVESVTGSDMYAMMTGGALQSGGKDSDTILKRASDALGVNGLKAIRYLDDGSRGLSDDKKSVAFYDSKEEAAEYVNNPLPGESLKFEKAGDKWRVYKAQQRTRNYVVLDAERILITEKNGKRMDMANRETRPLPSGQCILVDIEMDGVVKRGAICSPKFADDAEIANADFDPEKHPRASDGTFTDGEVLTDSKGAPVEMYHGTSASFDSFDDSKQTVGTFGRGFYFSNDRSLGRTYSGGKEPVKAHLTLTNPKIYRHGDFSEKGQASRKDFRRADVREHLEKQGYDGVLVKDADDPDYIEVVVFKAAQIKRTDNLKNTDAHEVHMAAHTAAASPFNHLAKPTPAQIEADNYKLGRMRLCGVGIGIENPAGSRRRPEYDPLIDHYGRIFGTKGADGDALDCFIRHDRPDSGKVFVVNQNDENGEFEEHKIVMGADTAAQARGIYERNYQIGWNGFGSVVEFTPKEFRMWARTPQTVLANGDFDENEHPRDAIGQFADKSDAGPSSGDGAQIPTVGKAGGGGFQSLEVDGVSRPVTDSNGKRIHPTDEGTRNFWRWATEGGRKPIVDNDGRPVRVFHGSDQERTIFEGGTFLTDSMRDASAYAEMKALQNEVDNNDDLSEIVYDVMAEQGADELTDLGPKAIRDIAEANGIAIGNPDGHVTEAFMRAANPLDLTAFGSDVGDVEKLWTKMFKAGLLSESWDAMDEYALDEVKQDYDGKALYKFLEKEGIQSKAFAKGFDAIILTDISPDGGRTHISYLTKDDNQIKSATGNTGAFDPKDKRIANADAPNRDTDGTQARAPDGRWAEGGATDDDPTQSFNGKKAAGTKAVESWDGKPKAGNTPKPWKDDHHKGWLAPDGKFLNMTGPLATHEGMARKIVGVPWDAPYSMNDMAADKMFEQRWLRVVPYGADRMVVMTRKGQFPTREQRKAIVDHMIGGGLESVHLENGTGLKVIASTGDMMNRNLANAELEAVELFTPQASAVERISAKTPIGSILKSKQWHKVNNDLRDRAFFSCRIQSAKTAQLVRDKIVDVMNQVRKPARIEGDVLMTRGRLVSEVRQLDEYVGSSDQIRFIYDTNKNVAHGFAQYKAGMDDGILFAYPCWELARTFPVTVPRGEEVVRGVVQVQNGWDERWQAACEEAGDDLALTVFVEQGRMVARKDSEVWQALGDGAGGYEDTLGAPFPPFAFNSGMDVSDVNRFDSIELGLIEDEEEVESPEDVDFNDELEADVSGLDNDILAALLEMFGPLVKFFVQTNVLRWLGRALLNREFDESEHPRAPDGKFADAGGGSYSTGDLKPFALNGGGAPTAGKETGGGFQSLEPSSHGLGQTQSASWLYAEGHGKASPLPKAGVYVGNERNASGHLHGMTKEALEWHLANGNFSTVTAANPNGVMLSNADNMARMKTLFRSLRKDGATYIAVRGKYGSPEPSAMVFHDDTTTPAKIREIGHLYGQHSVMNVNKGKALIALTSEGNVGRVIKSRGYEFVKDADDYYSEVAGHKFRVDFPPEGWENPEHE